MSQGTRLNTNKTPNPMPTELKVVQNIKEQSHSRIHLPCTQESDDLIEELKKYFHEK